ncbi:hypothetical protein [Ammoniphilus oxalaticus]|uniref:hypothetical protein n=1 Tax=Ammoniphilus oxalaticus TaxID=66863 RepID=UPI0014734A80|nr:hypothetical protein [Ammoniphilus oxalaticus]
MRKLQRGLALLLMVSLLSSCQTVQQQTNKEAPNQKKQKESREELKKSGGESDKD